VSRSDEPFERPAPDAVPLESLLCTEELQRRPAREPAYREENLALVALASALSESPRTILQTLADTILDVTGSDSSGVSLLTADGERFYWPALAGRWTPHVGGGTPRNFGPCGDVLDRNTPLLMKHWERRYAYFTPISPPVVEGLLVPFHVGGTAVGTIWAVMHDDRRRFDAEDLRLLSGLGAFASTAYQTLKSIDALRVEIGERQKAEEVARELATGLETQVRARTHALEREIAERRRAEDDLRRSRAFLAEGLRLARMGNFSWHVDSGEITWSEQIYGILELDEHQPMSRELLASRVHPDDRDVLSDVVRLARDGAAEFEYEPRLLMPDGSVKHLHLIGHRNVHHDGHVEYIGAIQDVTQRRRAEQALAKARGELAHAARVTGLGALTASIAHEVNQPLAAIANNGQACLDLLSQGDAAAQDDVRAGIAEIIEDAYRASAVVGRIRDLVRKEPSIRTTLRLQDVVDAVSAFARHESAAQGVTIRTELPDDLPAVDADRVQLQQVLLNLVMNGMDAMKTTSESQRVLTIRGACDGGDGARRCVVRVCDAGVGIEPGNSEKLFETFYTTKPDGMGMGLAISRSIIEAHGGRLWAERNDGPGATFVFSLPAAAATASRAQ
jgi:signal transduction histidine kinase